MKITIRQEWQSMIEGAVCDELDVMETKLAYATALEKAVRGYYPSAEIAVLVSDEPVRYGVVIEDVPWDEVPGIGADVDLCTDVVRSYGDYWVVKP